MSLQLDIPCDDDTAITTKRAQGPRLQAMPSHYSLNRDPSTPLPLLQSDTDLCSNLLDAILENEYVHYLVIKTLHCSDPTLFRPCIVLSHFALRPIPFILNMYSVSDSNI